ncbi:DUF4262 domain-containing protein [Aquabacterium sp.]|uniref:DUF4262 domain-containing protein n=1 Tax=Aquabacterium sp. TaxID=1872578 RepID=UPI00261EE14A|nr:DUF4262 domain-containing protein [Aquabacterium sp.]MDD2977125.1 DUF4262 domain-containing protein [Aquabacterium sp.]
MFCETPPVEEGEQVLENIATYGWHCVHVPQMGHQLAFTYTIGLYHSYKHPELLVYGANAKAACDMIKYVGTAARDDEALDLDQPTDKLMDGHSCVFVEVPYLNFPQRIEHGLWFYEDVSFPLRQIVWTSNQGLFPWHPESSVRFRASQPLLVATH